MWGIGVLWGIVDVCRLCGYLVGELEGKVFLFGWFFWGKYCEIVFLWGDEMGGWIVLWLFD